MVRVDEEKCIGCGVCVALCPSGFELREGKSIVKSANAPCIDQALNACPVQAIEKD